MQTKRVSCFTLFVIVSLWFLSHSILSILKRPIRMESITTTDHINYMLTFGKMVFCSFDRIIYVSNMQINLINVCFCALIFSPFSLLFRVRIRFVIDDHFEIKNVGLGTNWMGSQKWSLLIFSEWWLSLRANTLHERHQQHTHI